LLRTKPSRAEQVAGGQFIGFSKSVIVCCLLLTCFVWQLRWPDSDTVFL